MTRLKSIAIVLVCCVICAPAVAAKKGRDRDRDNSPPAEKKKKDPEKQAPAASGDVPKEVIKRESKIEFDERVVQGQRAQGAVYLFQRAESKFGSLVKTPGSFRERTVRQVFGE